LEVGPPFAISFCGKTLNFGRGAPVETISYSVFFGGFRRCRSRIAEVLY
jgi:hypothetical protein